MSTLLLNFRTCGGCCKLAKNREITQPLESKLSRLIRNGPVLKRSTLGPIHANLTKQLYMHRF